MGDNDVRAMPSAPATPEPSPAVSALRGGIGIAAHTPGPWHVEGVYVRDDEDRMVADCDCFQYTDDGEVQLDDCESNARLIAAAPTMAAQLESSQVDLDLLRRAIEEGDPKAELLIRVADLRKRNAAALASTDRELEA